ncbi:MAG: Na+/H+ antiporter NhaC family protein [Ruminococcaceae bacterium]|nr:Na+/H+ antiporter NhaC family protein [Oscillospiraceae bacterium]
MKNKNSSKVNKGNPIALLPIGIFLILYLGLGLFLEYGLKIKMGFYNIPIVISFLAALLVACLQNRKLSLDKKFEVMGNGVGDKNIITMIIIFLMAGIFVGVVGRSSAESVAYFVLSIIPPKFAVAVLFVVSCFISLAMGTSVGTITLITPIAVSVSAASGFSLPLCVGSVVGGAMFGDNLSFISDTTIAACNGQGCKMSDKFRENFAIALPAAIVTLILIIVLSLNTEISGQVSGDYDLVLIIPYLLVFLGGIIGINVFAVLLIGIISGAGIMLYTGSITGMELLGNMGTGASGMFETSMVAILVSAICALIREHGGFEALLYAIRKIFRGRRGGQLGMGLLVGAMDIATANNTVAIVMANPIAKEMSENYGITPRKTASLLDTFSCIFQGIIPYGAQMLVAISAVNSLGSSISAFDIIPYLFYPFLLFVSSLIFIFVIPEKKKK